MDIPRRQTDAVCVKAPVFPFLKLRGLDPAPGPAIMKFVLLLTELLTRPPTFSTNAL